MATVSQITQFGPDRAYPDGTVKRRYEVTLQGNTGLLLTKLIGPFKMLPADDPTLFAEDFLNQRRQKELGLDDIQPEWNDTQADYDRRSLGKAMLINDAVDFFAYLPLFKAMETRSGANASQRAATLGVTSAEYNLMASRFNDVEGVAFFLTDAKDAVWTEIPAEWN